MLIWLVENVPAWVVYILLAVGCVGIIGGYFLRRLPPFHQHATVVFATSFATALLGVWLAGALFVSDEWKARIADSQSEATQAQVEAANTNLQLIERLKTYEDQLKEKQRVRTKYVTQYITKYDNRCDLPNATIRLLSAAAQDELPPGPSDTDGDSSNVAISTVVQNTTDNYSQCYAYRKRLIEWQNWYTEQKAIFEKDR